MVSGDLGLVVSKHSKRGQDLLHAEIIDFHVTEGSVTGVEIERRKANHRGEGSEGD